MTEETNHYKSFPTNAGGLRPRSPVKPAYGRDPYVTNAP